MKGNVYNLKLILKPHDFIVQVGNATRCIGKTQRRVMKNKLVVIYEKVLAGKQCI
jgi:hypothetical protein